MRCKRGFSLIELIIVVMIIGIIGAIAIPRISRGSEGARVSAFVAELNTIALAIEQYKAEQGAWPADSASGLMPSELTDYLRTGSWEGGTPIGGEWDIEANDIGGITLAVGAHAAGDSLSNASLLEIDTKIDDGDLTTGAFRTIAAGRHYLVLEE